MKPTDSDESSYITLQQRTHGLLEEYQRALSRLETLEDDDEGGSGLPKHTLQLRKDQEDILKKTLHLHQNLCKALGIESQSLEHNKDRAHFALGVLDLQKKLANLAHLAHLLSDVMGLIQKILALEKHKTFKKTTALKEAVNESPTHSAEVKAPEEKPAKTKAKTETHKAELMAALKSVADLQMRFQHSLEQLTQAFQRYPGLPEFGVLYNHIAGVQHAASLFFTSKSVPTSEPKPAAEQVEQTARWARFLPYR
jgi:hypothetical protein